MYIVFTADCHLRNFNYNRKMLGISERTVDLIDRMAFMVDHAIENDAKLFVIAGDLYDQSGYMPSSPDTWVNKPVNSNMKKMFRSRILLPLMKKGIKILIIGGNHDSHPQLEFGCDIEELNLANNISVKRNIDVKKYRIDNERVSFITLPYIRPSAIFKHYINADGRFDGKNAEISPQNAAEYISGHVMPAAIEKAKESSDHVIVTGHYHVIGTRVTNLPTSFSLKEMEFNRTMIKESEIDLAVFGHIHKHQALGNKIVVPGSIERMNFGERDERKYFIGYDTGSGTWKPVELQCRPMIQVDVTVADGSTNPTMDIISAIKEHDITDALLKIHVIASPSTRRNIDKLAIVKATETAFHLHSIDDAGTETVGDEMVDLSGMELVPEALLERFVNMKYISDSEQYRKMLIERTLKYMRE